MATKHMTEHSGTLDAPGTTNSEEGIPIQLYPLGGGSDLTPMANGTSEETYERKL